MSNSVASQSRQMATQLVATSRSLFSLLTVAVISYLYLSFFFYTRYSPAQTEKGEEKNSGVSVGRWVGWGVAARKREEDRKDLL